MVRCVAAAFTDWVMRSMQSGGEMRTGSATSEQELWTAARLRRTVRRCCGDRRVIVVANREPFRHERAIDGEPVVSRSASGVVTALEPLLEACHGVWIAHGAGSADRDVVDSRDTVAMPPERPTYRLRRVWLDAYEERHYYVGFANEALWPLCHQVGVRPTFRRDDFTTYARVNAKFAAAACAHADDDAPVVLVQDYHFALAPRRIALRLPRSTIITFWHIPWPSAAAFETCPWSRVLLEGLLGSRTIGFHTNADCEHFLDSVEQVLHADVDRVHGVVAYDGRETRVGAYPISIEWPSRVARDAAPVERCRREIRSRLGVDPAAQLIVGVDRIDYTKGICEKVLAFERLLERHPEFRHHVTFVQIAEPSRSSIPAYCDVQARVRVAVERVNRRFGYDGFRPVMLRDRHHEPAEVYEWLRAADVCYVGSLRDGMNLVAKEFVAARDDLAGVLVLSANAGASQQLEGALIVDPYAMDESAVVLARALRMPGSEQSARMRAMRAVVAQFNSYWWVGRMLEDAFRPPPQRPTWSAGHALQSL
jgi:trehalose 6-phosphate synthase